MQFEQDLRRTKPWFKTSSCALTSVTGADVWELPMLLKRGAYDTQTNNTRGANMFAFVVWVRLRKRYYYTASELSRRLWLTIAQWHILLQQPPPTDQLGRRMYPKTMTETTTTNRLLSQHRLE